MRTILVHGLAGSSRWWRDVERRLAGLDVEAVDLPRSGDLDTREEWLAERLGPRANLVGHSLGGLLAARLAARRPELVERLALIAPAGVPGRPLTGHALPLAHAVLRLRPRHAPVVLADALRAGPLSLLASGLAAHLADVRPQLPAIVAPTLVLWGADDRLVPASQAAHWAAGIPHAQVEILPRTGHVPMVERPEEVSRLLRAFLEGA